MVPACVLFASKAAQEVPYHGKQKDKAMPRKLDALYGAKPYANDRYATGDVSRYAGVSSSDLEDYCVKHFSELINKPQVQERQDATARLMWTEGSFEEVKKLREDGKLSPVGSMLLEFDPEKHAAMLAKKRKGQPEIPVY